MIINNYAVAMDAQYFNLKRDSLEVEVQTKAGDFTNDKSVNKIEIPTSLAKDSTDELSVELSKAILKNLNYQSSIAPIDKVEMRQTYEETQSLNYQVQAFIQTDSQEIELSLDISLSRSFIHKAEINIDQLKQEQMDIINAMLRDPLIVSLDGTMPTLSSDTFSFDIDSDGESDQISQLAEGNGFLAYDKNNNSKIDDGNELFGTQSGDGFADLSAHDDDGNGWIDENDAIFDKLRIWTKDGENDKLLALGEVGIGAIFLGSTTTPFEMKSDTNALLGEMRSSGFILKEDGTAGVISHIDLVVDKQTQEEIDSLKNAQRNSNLFSLGNTYGEDSQNSSTTGSTDSLIEKLDGKIKNLETKLSNANDDLKPALKSQISGLQAQKIAILARSIT